jgi:hypothetical protein
LDSYGGRAVEGSPYVYVLYLVSLSTSMELLLRPEYMLFIRYKELFCVDLRAPTMASLVLGFISYLIPYYVIFVGLRALAGGLK